MRIEVEMNAKPPSRQVLRPSRLGFFFSSSILASWRLGVHLISTRFEQASVTQTPRAMYKTHVEACSTKFAALRRAPQRSKMFRQQKITHTNPPKSTSGSALAASLAVHDHDRPYGNRKFPHRSVCA